MVLSVVFFFYFLSKKSFRGLVKIKNGWSMTKSEPILVFVMHINPLSLLLKIIMRHPYLKILDFANIFVADAPMKKNQEI